MAINLETLQIQFEIRDNTGSKLKKLRRQLAGLENPEIDADTEKAEKKIKDLKKDIESGGMEAEIDVNTDEAEKKVDKLEKEIDGLSDGDVEISADTKDAQKKIGEVEKSVKNMDDGSVEINADTSQAQDAIDSVEQSAKNIDDGSVEVHADTDTAQEKIDEFSEAVEDIPDNPKVEPEVDTTKAESSLKRMYNAMKALGLLKIGKEVFEFSMSAVNEAYADQAVQNQIANIGGTEAMDRIYAFTGEMNERYGMNETGLAEMAKNFTAVFKGTGMELDSALDYGIEMARYAIDYASALDKTPGEVADIFMSVLKGNTEVADSVGIYGLTADALSDQIDKMSGINDLESELAAIETKRAAAEQSLKKARAGSAQEKKEKERIKAYEEQEKALKAQIEQMEKMQEETVSLDKALAFFALMKENADEKMGFTGDWERTFNEYGNQRTVLGEQWQTLKQQIGTFLTPAATEGTLALNSLMTAIGDFTETLGKSSFAQDVNGYFGTMTVDEATMNAAISHVTKPLTEMTTALTEANASLDTANSNMSASYAKFLKLLGISGLDGELEGDLEEIAEAAEEFADDAVESVEVGRQSMIDRLNVFTGGLLSEETAAMYGIVDSYFDQAMERIEQKRQEFQEALDKWQNESTPQNAQELQNKTYALFEEAYQSTAGYMAVDEYDYLKSAYQSGHFSAETLETLMNGMMEASAEAEAQLQAELEATRRDYIAMGQGVINEETGKPYTVAELDEMFTASTAAYTESKRQEAESRRLGILSELLLGEYGSAATGVYDRLYKGEITGDEAMKQITEMVQTLEKSGFVDGLINASNKTPAMMSMLDLWYGLAQWTGGGGYSVGYKDSLYKALFDPDYHGSMAGGGAYSYARELYKGTQGYEDSMRQAGLATLWEVLTRTGMTNNPYYDPKAPDGIQNEKLNEIINRNWQFYDPNRPMPESNVLGALESILNTDLQPVVDFFNRPDSIDLFPTVPTMAEQDSILARGMGPLSQEFLSSQFVSEMEAVAGDFRTAVDAIPSSINLTMRLGSYEFGGAVLEGINTFNQSTGQ